MFGFLWPNKQRSLEVRAIALIDKSLREEDLLNRNWAEILALLKQSSSISFGTASKEFLKNPQVISFFNDPKILAFFRKARIISYMGSGAADGTHYTYNAARLWFEIEEYLFIKQSNGNFEKQLDQVRAVLITCMQSVTRKKKASGMNILPYDLANKDFIRCLYLTEDKELIELFEQYMPKARAFVFDEDKMPKVIKERKEESKKVLHKVLSNAEDKGMKEKFINTITKGQRNFRDKKRANENLYRIARRYKLDPPEAQRLIDDANTPYKPLCNVHLSDRIVAGAGTVTLFCELRHMTSNTAIESIFNDALFGRKTIVDLYLSFKPSVLSPFDIDEGDANVVCLGAAEIQHGVKQDIELVFDAALLAKDNPTAFFKQRDLGFEISKKRTIEFGYTIIRFSHTDARTSFMFNNISEPKKFLHTPFALFPERERQLAAEVPNSSLISNNLNAMHQILILNFFRFIDKLPAEYNNLKNAIYSELESLDDDQLAEKLKEIGRKMSDTMEFNFYGAHRIDFDSLLKIRNKNVLIDLPVFIAELQKSNISLLKNMMISIPEIFDSYRFIDYLLSKVKDPSVVALLAEKRQGCKLPYWESEQNRQP